MIAPIAERATEASAVWGAAVIAGAAPEPVYGPQVDQRFALGVETIHEGYLVHHGRSRAFEPADTAAAILLGDYLYAAGLVEICRAGDIDAVGTLAELIADVSDLRARGDGDDGRLWAAAARKLGGSRELVG